MEIEVKVELKALVAKVEVAVEFEVGVICTTW